MKGSQAEKTVGQLALACMHHNNKYTNYRVNLN
jgi:hypothetical protein